MTRAGAALLIALAALAPAVASRPKVDARTLAPEPARPVVLSPAATAAVQGRARGLPAECIDETRPIAVRIVDRTTILWEMTPRRWYVNLPEACPALRLDRVLATRSGNGRICRGDRIGILGTPDGRLRGTCRLGPFIPYWR